MSRTRAGLIGAGLLGSALAERLIDSVAAPSRGPDGITGPWGPHPPPFLEAQPRATASVSTAGRSPGMGGTILRTVAAIPPTFRTSRPHFPEFLLAESHV
jgi:hypothetical protein